MTAFDPLLPARPESRHDDVSVFCLLAVPVCGQEREAYGACSGLPVSCQVETSLDIKDV